MDRKILLVEDSPTEALRTRLILERDGYQVSLASDGREGLDRALAEKPDLIVLDTVMPKMGGYEVCGRLRINPTTTHIPIVMLISHDDAAFASLAGAGNVVAKPFEPPVLLNKVRELIQNHTGSENGEGIQQVAQTLGVGWVLLEDGTIVSVNPAAETLFDLSAGDLIGKRFVDYLHDDRAAFLEMLSRAETQGGEGRFRIQIDRRRMVWWYITATLVSHGSHPVMQLVCLDITNWVKAERDIQQYTEELEQARQAVAAAHRVKSDLLAVMSHELLTPLHEFIGMLELALDTRLTKKQREYLSTAKMSGNALQAIIKDILEFSEADMGKLTIEERDFNLWDTVERTADLMTSHTQEKGLEFSIHIAPNVPQTMVGDPGRLRQVLVNLVGNAVKFTDQGEVTIRVSVVEDRGDEVELHFLVHDTGIGISAERQAVIFEAFQGDDTPLTRRHGGIGLGLALSRQLVELMGGRIWVESQLDEGSTFHFTVVLKRQIAHDKRPSPPPPPPPSRQRARVAPPAAAAAESHLHILLAEDSPTNQLIAVANLNKAGHAVQVAENGLIAIQMLEKEPFDLVLMDVAMPEMDGLEATRAIRVKEAKSGGHIPIIAMTAFATEEYRDKCLEAGMDGYVSKPVTPNQLREALVPFQNPPPVKQVEAESSSSAPAAVDLSRALKVVGGDLNLLEDVVKMSRTEYSEQLAILDAGLAGKDRTAIEGAAHKLKGILDSVGGLQARDIARRLEKMAQEGDLDSILTVLQELKGEIERVVAFYAKSEWREEAHQASA